MIRLRQVALVARDLDRVVDELCERLGLTVCYHDPGVSHFGLHNALMMIGDQFLEVVAPTQDGTTAGRLLDKRGGDGGYMAIYEVDDLDAREAALEEAGIRMPSFFGYMAWSCGILLPLFVLLTVIFFR